MLQTKTAQSLIAGDVIAPDGIPSLVLSVLTGANLPGSFTAEQRTRVSFRPCTHPDGAAVRYLEPLASVELAPMHELTAAILRANVGDCVASANGAHRLDAGKTHCRLCGAN